MFLLSKEHVILQDKQQLIVKQLSINIVFHLSFLPKEMDLDSMDFASLDLNQDGYAKS